MMVKTRVSGVPYEVELAEKNQTFNNLIDDVDSLIAELERENLLMRARMDRLENELRLAEAEVARLKINIEYERNKKS
jgi:ABC-type phosphate transport system auxiliary subunit